MDERQTVNDLLRALRTRAGADQRDSGAAELTRTVELIDELGSPAPVMPSARPATKHLGPATAGVPAEHQDLAETFNNAIGLLRWEQAYSGSTDPRLADLHDGYAYTVLAGPQSMGHGCPYNTDDLLLGFTIQAPNVFYPSHRHPAIETYGVVSGTADWLSGDGHWTPRPPGSVIIHQRNEAHGMRTGDEPLLCWFSWVSDVKTPPTVD